ncbi:MAG TPA: hypothetical protein VJ508_08280, partial [Saprospiraceae bacterium]|nr:hypothetical protein [Saprospiraceae bacterium]
MTKLTHFLLLLFSLTLTSLAAQEDSMKTTMMMDPIQPDRPLQSQSSYLVPKGYFQMEHGFSIEDTDPGFIYSYPSSLWKFGVNENFEIRLTTQYITIQHDPDP